MLKLENSNNGLIKQWRHEKNEPANLKTIIFTVHNTDILDYFEDKKSITICYGFIDQEIGDINKAQYIAKQICQHGIIGLNHCYGSFIVISYSKINQQVIIANDALGDFAVHYIINDTVVHISDFPKALLNENNLSINHNRLLHYFALSQPQQKAGFFENICQLKPGQYLTLKAKSTAIDTYYKPPVSVDYKTCSLKELSEQFKLLMQSVITLQTQGQKKVGLMLSGGMDSTFVAANCLQADKQLSTFSYVFPHMPEANESFWIDAMRKMDLDMHTFSGEPHWSLKSPWSISLNAPISNPYRHLKSVIYQRAQSENLKILLTGVFADHLYTGYIYWLVDQIKRKPLTAIKSLYSITRQNGLKTCLRQIAPAKWSNKSKLIAPWLNKKSLQTLKNMQQGSGNKHPHPQQYALAFGMATAQSCWLENEYAFKHKLSLRHPFRDRRVVEFIMSIPAWILGNNNQPKRFVQKTAVGLLPETIIRRKKTTTLKPLFIKGVLKKELKKVRDLLNSPQCSWQQFVRKELIHNILHKPNGHFKDSDYMILWQCIAYELWRKRLRTI